MVKFLGRKVYAAGVAAHPNGQILIVTFTERSDVSRLWHFPRGQVGPGEAPEVALRRIFDDNLGTTVSITTGQPPFVCRLDDQEIELRYFFCEASPAEFSSEFYTEALWIPPAHLREYDFDTAAKPVVDWLL